MQFDNVTVLAKANVYFDGKVISHTVRLPDGSRKTLGLIYPGKYNFGTDQAEHMQIISGECRVKLDGATEFCTYPAGTAFEVPAKSGFDIEVPAHLCEYVCSFVG
jgi:purine/pyrimidine-nucleoside phosphorylase